MRLLTTILLAMFSFALFGQEGRNCGAMEELANQLLQDPSMEARMQAIQRHTEEFEHAHEHGNGERVVITIPVVFHIVHNGDALGSNENLPESLILAQLEQLNQDFALLNSDASLIPALFQPVAANTEIQFCLAQRKPDGTATTGINRVNGGQASWTQSQINSTLKPSTIWDRNQYLNIWSVVFGGSSSSLLGYAQFPGGAANTDGVVVVYSSVGSVALPNPAGGSYARGRTATHEIGHWLNLRHIWGDATCGSDLVADTPTHNTSNSGCPTYPHLSTCTGTPVEMTMNYMDYTFDACMYMFTAGQKTRMQAVLATGGSRASLLSSQGCVPVEASTCGTPTGLSATNVTTSSATLNWVAVSGATSYNIRYRVVGTTTWSSTTSSGLSVGVSGLSSSTQYEFQVQAVCSTTGSFSASSTFTTGIPASCGTPSGLSASNITANSATVSWASVSGAISYNVRYRIVGAANWTTAGSTPGLALSISGLAAGTNYEYQVQAVCASSTGSFSASGTFSTPTASGCSVPSNLTASNVTTTTATLNWGAVGSASYYNVRYRVVGAATWTNTTAFTNSLTLSGLSVNTTYEFQVQSACDRTQSDYSASATFTTGSSQSCGTPTGLNATNVTTSTATLNWASVSGAASYNVRYRPVGSSVWTNATSSTTSFAVSGLSANTSYEYQVQAVCGSTPGAYSSSATFTTLPQASCGTPSGLNATAVTANSATLNWASVSGATSYNVRYRIVGSASWQNNATSSLSLAISGLSSSSNYEFQVQAVCGSTTGNFSASANFTTLSGGGACADNYEPNDAPSTGLPATPVNSDLFAVIATGTDNDYFRFANSLDQRNIRIDLSNLPADFDVQLYEGSTLIGSSAQGGTTPEVIIYNRAIISSNFYVRVYGYNGASSNQCYTLRISTSSIGFRTTDGSTSELPEGELPVLSNQSGFLMFPNPARTEVNLDVVMDAERSVQVMVFDLSGKALLNRAYNLDKSQNRVQLDISQLPVGLYTVQVKNGRMLGTQKLNVIR